jgi:nucleoside-diphosphate-sugar epimerase
VTGSVCLITGAGGFIGAHLVRRLLDRNHRVHAIVRPGSPTSRLDDLGGAITLHHLDLADGVALERCIASVAPQRVYHLAANTRDRPDASPSQIGSALSSYVDPLMQLVELLAGLARPPQVLVRAGSIAEYGASPIPYREDWREYPATPYGVRMLAGTHLLEMLAPSLPFAAHTARLALTYGEGQANSFLLPALIEACASNRPITLRRPDDRRDLIHVSDVVDALILLGEKADGESLTVNIATGVAPAMREVAGLVCAITGCDHALVNFGAADPSHPPSVLLASPEKAREKLGWSAKIGLEQGLRLLLEPLVQQPPESRLRCG